MRDQKFVLYRERGSVNGVTSTPLGYADTANECWEYAVNEFKRTDFARAPFWDTDELPPGYRVEPIDCLSLKRAPWLNRLLRSAS